MSDFRDDIRSFGATPWRRSVEAFESAARKIKSAGQPAPAVPSLTPHEPAPTIPIDSERLFSAFMDHWPYYAWIKNADGSYVYVNERVKELRPFQHDWLGKTDADLWPSHLSAEYRQHDLKVIKKGESLETVESCFIDGEQHFLLVSKFPLFDESGAVSMVAGTGVDITEHKRVEEALRESERFRRMIIESEPECVKLVARDYTLLDINPAGLEVIEATAGEQVVGQSVLNLIAPEYRAAFIEMHQRVCRGESLVSEFEIVGLKGSHRWMESHAAPLLDKDSRVIGQLAITRDVTERKRAEEQLRSSGTQLAEAQRIAHLGSWSWNLNCEVQLWSDELYRIYGLEPGEIAPTYEAFLKLVHPDDRLELGESVERATKLREPIDLNFRIIRPDGEERIIHSRGRIVYDDQENPIGRLGTAQDVTEQRSAEAALRAAEQKYRDIVENAVEGIFQTTPDGKFISANPALIRMFGFSSAEELIRERADISHQHYVDPKRREELKQQLEDHGVVREFEFQAYRKDGSTIWLSENVRAVRDDMGRVLYYEGTAQDITERRRTNQALSLFRTLIDRSSDAIEVIDPDTLRFIDSNESAYQDLGYSREEFLALSVYDIDPLIDMRIAERIIRELDRAGFVVFESIHRRKDGSTFPVEVNLKTVTLEREYRLAVVRDISERKRAEAALRESEERFRQLSEAALEAILIHNNGTVLEVNQSFCRMYGYERAEVIGKSVLDLALPELGELLLQTMRSGDTGSYEGPALRKDGTTFRAEVAGRPIHYQGRVVRVAAIRDITEQKRNERRLAAQYAVTRVLAGSATLAEAIPELLRVICESLRWKVGEFWLVSDNTNLLSCVETWHVPGLEATSFIKASSETEFAPGAGLPGRVWQSGQPAWSPDVMTDPRFARAALAAKVGLRGALAFPILLGNHTLGVMQFFSRRTPEVDEDLLKIMSAIGSQIGQFTERKRAEESLRKQNEYLAALHETALGLINRLDLNELLEVIITRALALVGIPGGHVYLLEPGGTEMSVKVGVGVSRDFVGARISKGQGLAGRIWETGQPLVVDDYRNWEHRLTNPGYDALRLVGAVPLRSGSKVVGVLGVESTEDSQGLGEHQIEILNRFAQLASIALDNAQLHSAVQQELAERKRAGEELRASEERYRELFEQASDMIFKTDARGNWGSFNPAALKLLKYGEKELMGKYYLDLVKPEYRSAVKGFYQEQFRTKTPNTRYEFPAIAKDGTEVWIEQRATLLFENDQAAGLHLVARDITERKRAEAALRESEERYRDLVENSREFICTHDLNGLILSANRAASEVLGYDLKDYCGNKNYRDLLVPEVRDQFEDYLARLRRDGVASGLTLVQTSSGERRLLEYHNSVRTEGVATPIVRGMARDITEQRRAEKAMSALRRELELTMNSMEEGVHRVDLKGTIVFENPAAARMLGWGIDQLLGKPAHLTMHHTRPDGTPYPKEECPIYATFRDGLARQVADEVFWRQDGTSFPVEYQTAAMRNDRNEIVATVVTFRDVTERKRADEKLQNSEKYFRSLIENASDVITISDGNGIIRYESPSLERMLGYKPEERIGKSVLDLLHPDDLPLAKRHFAKGIRNPGIVHVMECRFQHKDGSWHLVETTGINLLDDPVVAGIVVNSRDITERKRAEEALRESEERYRELFENAKDATYVHDLGGRYTSVNRAAEKLSGYSRAEIIGKSFTEFIGPEQIEIISKHLCRKLVEEGETTYESEVIARDGRRVPVEVSSHVIYENGASVGVQGTARDITERKRAEAALRESEERFAKAFHVSPAALSVSLLEGGQLLEVNGAFLRMTGYQREEVIGKSTLELGLWRDADERIAMAGLLRERGTVTDLEFIFRKKSGEERNGLLSVDLIELSGKPCVLGIAQDITERKRAEVALRNYSHLLMTAQEAERQRIARELHDQIGQVLTAIRINLQTIQTSPDAGESTSLIDEGIGMVDAALEQVRDLSFELRPSLLDDLGLAAALRRYVNRYAQRTGIAARTSICPESRIRLPHELETACFRIVQEALTNVARHAQAASVTIDVSTVNGTLSLSIKDDGLGFDLDSLTNGGSASSLGLRGMEERAQGLGGKLEIKSAPLAGTEVRAVFPSGSERKESL